MCAKKSSAPLLRDWVNEYLDTYVRPVCKPSSTAYFADNLLKHVVPALGDVPLDEIDSATLQRFFNDQAAHGRLTDGGPLSTKSIRNLRTAVSGCFTMAVAQGVLGKNPVPGTVIRRSVKPVVETMSETDHDKLMNFLFTDPNLMNLGIILCASLAMRRGEVCALRWKDYDGAYLHIHSTVKRLPSDDPQGPKTKLVFGPAKTEAAKRDLALPPDLCTLLDLQAQRFADMFGAPPGPEDFIVFNAVGTLTDPDNLTHYFSDVLAGLGLKHVKLHALRHTFATRAVEQGIDIETVSGLLGHTDVTTTTHYYLHPRQEAMNNALWKLSSAVGTPPKKLPCVVRGQDVSHKYTRRASFAVSGEGAAV